MSGARIESARARSRRRTGSARHRCSTMDLHALAQPDLETARAGLLGWLSDVDHKAIGRRYLVTAFVFLAPGGLRRGGDAAAAGARRRPGLIGPDLYNQLFTMHGTTMMFLFAVPVMQAFADLSRAADGGHAQHRLPAPERLQLLDLPVRRALRSGSPSCSNIGPGRRLVRLCAAVGAGIRARQARRRLGADDHLHRGVGAGGRGRDHRHGAQAARARHDARPHPAVRLGDAGDLVRGHLRDAGGDARLAPC